jgi:hypothetical protein
MVYFLFLRKETYFNFNRIYLLGIMALALIIPVVHITIAVTAKDNIEETFHDIGKLRSYYTEFVAMGDAEFGREKYRNYPVATFEENYYYAKDNEKANRLLKDETGGEGAINSNTKSSKINLLKLIIIVYLLGVLFFLVRLIVLLTWLANTVKSNPRQRHKNYKLVLMEKEVPPFSFFRYIFVTKEATQLNQFEQVLAHEKVHVGQMHSLDLIIAHAITVFQWFNPLVWNLQKAIKTTHEYIADSKVVNQGFELFDYQSLLLSQLVSIQSVELVNNFNLISIKKRIAMMTKSKSRFSAKLKALIIIPMALVTFFLFADMTIKSPVLNFTNFSSAKVSNLDGIWENSSDTFGKLLLFKGSNLSILESSDKVDVIDLDIVIKDEVFEFNRFGKAKESLKYQLSGSELKIWWTDNEYAVYKKTHFKNSSDAFTPKEAGNIKLPMAEYAKILEKPNLVINVYVYSDKYIVEDVECKLANLKEVLSNKFTGFNKLDWPFITARLVVDEDTEMKSVNALKQVMREISLLRVSYGSFPKSGASELQFHASGLTKMLPPLGAEDIARDEIEERIFDIVDGDDLNLKAKELRAFVENHPDYIMVYQNKNSTLYGNYIAASDMVFKVFYGLRNEYTQAKFNLKYIDLPKNLQKEVRKKYPMRLSETNSDEE